LRISRFEEVNEIMKTSGIMALLAALLVLAMAAPAAGMFEGVSGGPSMSYAGVSGSMDGVFARYTELPTFPAPWPMTGEDFCEMVAAHLANPPKAWDW